MNKEQEVMLDLICKSQFPFNKIIDFNSINMNDLFDEASNQTIVGLLANEIPNDIRNKKWQMALFKQKALYIKYCHAEEELITVLNNAHIPYVVLKGNSVAIYYKEPMLRAMGDIDILIPQLLYRQAKNILCDNGYVEVIDDGRNTSFYKNEIKIELHHHFSSDIDIEEHLIDGLNYPVKGCIENHSFYMLPKIATGLVLLDHIKWHLRSGIGLRQIIDWMMYSFKNIDDEFWHNEFEAVVKNKGLEVLAVTVTRMCQIYLGLPETINWCKSADENNCKRLMTCLLDSGNFGIKNGKGFVIEKTSINIKRDGLLHWLQRAGEHNWKAYHKHQWLKPFCWFYQIFRYARQGIKFGRNNRQLKRDLDRSKERYELLKLLGID